MKKLLGALALITVLVGVGLVLQSATPEPSRGFNNLHVLAITIDTLTDAENDTLYFDKYFDYPAEVTVSLNNFELSGTATALYTVQQSATASSTVNWVTTDTLSTSTATGTAVINLTNRPELTADNRLWGYRMRIIADGTGTGVHRYNVNMIARRLER
jgi:hypothetical protein